MLHQIVTLRQDVMLNNSSQIGKTEVISASAYLLACYGLRILLITPSDRQSMEFHERLIGHHERLKLVRHTSPPTKHEMSLASGGRVIALPNSPDKVRGIPAVDFLIVDEASRVPDALYGACTRMLAVTKGQQVLLSTPFGKRGFFWKEWSEGTGWQKHRIPWHQCPRITQDHIDAERRRWGDAWVQQEYLDCPDGDEFVASNSGVFDVDAWKNLMSDDIEILDW